jgi:hypothetical protein
MYDLGIFDSIRGIHIFVVIFLDFWYWSSLLYISRNVYIYYCEYFKYSQYIRFGFVVLGLWVGGGELSPVMNLGEFRKGGFIKFHKMYMIDVWRHIM